MKIFVTGSAERVAEIKPMLEGRGEVYYYEEQELPRPEKLKEYELFIDLNLDEQPENLESYAAQAGKAVIGCAVKKSLADMLNTLPVALECRLAGMNLLPTFIHRSRAEVAVLNESDKESFSSVFQALGWEPEWVQDRVGMVTPRIVFMIINEACYTVQEGTAGMEDIDKSMKLGTNYPMGPFEWSRKAGLRNVYEALEAIYQDTHEERYKICPLLKRKYLLGEEL